MPKTIQVQVTGLPSVKDFVSSVAVLVRALAACQGDIPEPVMQAADQVRQGLAELAVRDIPPPGIDVTPIEADPADGRVLVPCEGKDQP